MAIPLLLGGMRTDAQQVAPSDKPDNPAIASVDNRHSADIGEGHPVRKRARQFVGETDNELTRAGVSA